MGRDQMVVGGLWWASYRVYATNMSGKAAAAVKVKICQSLPPGYLFEPLALLRLLWEQLAHQDH